MSLSPIPGEEATPVRSDGGGSVEMSKIWALAPTVRELPAVTDQEGEARSGGVMSVHNLLSHSESDVPLSKDTIESASDPNSSRSCLLHMSGAFQYSFNRAGRQSDPFVHRLTQRPISCCGKRRPADTTSSIRPV